MNKIFTISLKKEFVKEEKKVKLAIAKILKILNKKNVSVEIYLAGSRTMRSLNKKLRGKDKVANVLSFEEPEEFIQNPPDRGTTQNKRKMTRNLGEIYLNAEREDENFSKEFLLVHGILHLLGYDHIKESDAIKMGRKEKSVLVKLKIEK